MELLALVVGASSESIYGIKKAKQLGYSVLAFDGDKNAEGFKYADEAYVTDIKDPESIIAIIGIRRPSVILPVPIGRLLVTCGALNDFYHLKGISLESCELCTDKYKFHQILNEHNLRRAECWLINAGEVKPETEAISFPAVVKPRYGSGSRAVFVVNSKDEFEHEFVANLPYDEDFLIETLVGGDEYGIDAAVINGSLNIVLVRKKSITPLPARQCVGYYSVVPDGENEHFLEELRHFFEAVILQLKMNDCIFHADIMYNGRELFLIEISPRPSGHHLHNNFTIRATGIDMLEEYILYTASSEWQPSFVPKEIKKLLIHYFDFGNCKILKIPNSEALLMKYPLLEYKCDIDNVHLGKVVDGHSLMDRGYFILQANSDAELGIYAEQILNEFEVEADE